MRSCKSYLKWVGGKQQLAEFIIPRLPAFQTFVEPFCGSAAIFFNLFSSEENSLFSNNRRAVLADANPLLINTHRCVSDAIDVLEPCLLNYERHHRESPAEFYKSQTSRVKGLKINHKCVEIDLAALFIYLNKSSFNGIWRLNKGGGFNTPWNQKPEVSLVSRHLQECSFLLRRYAEIECAKFDETIEKHLSRDAFFFLDPPYVPLSETASFVGYTESGWGDDDNLRLREMMELIDRSGAKFMMTNSTAPAVKELFGRWNIVEVKASRMVRASSDRPTVMESIVTNY